MITEITVAVATALILGLGTLAYRAMMRGIKAYLRDEVRTHLVPNGGGSIPDRLKALEESVGKLTSEAEKTGCLPGCPVRQGFWPTGTPAPWTAPPVSYGSPQGYLTATPQPSPPGTPMPTFVAPTWSTTPEQTS